MANNTKGKRLQKIPREFKNIVLDDMKNLSQILRQERKSKGLTQEKLAEQVDVSLTTIQSIEQLRTSMSLELLLTILKALKIKLVVG